MEAIQTAASNTYRVRVVLYSPIDVAPAAGPSSSPVLQLDLDLRPSWIMPRLSAAG